MNIVAFPFHDWRKQQAHGFRTRDGHILERFDQHESVSTVLVVDRPVSLAERIAGRLPSTAEGKLVHVLGDRHARGRIAAVGSRTLVLDISVPDLIKPAINPRRWWFDIFARPAVHDLVDRAAQMTVGDDVRVIAWTPTVAGTVAALAPTSLVFDSLDNWITHPDLRKERNRAIAAYQRILTRADTVVVSAPASRDVLARWATNIEVIGNGVSVAAFGAPGPRPSDLPKGPTVGYAGTLGPRIDTTLVVAVARALPDVQFIFIGRGHRPTERLISAERNIRVLGDRNYRELSTYLAAFDLAWIPHAVGAGESGGDPIKMYEYWAAGRQVVATPIDGLQAWAHQLHLVTNPAEASAVIRGLLDGSRPSTPTIVPPERTWEAISDCLVQYLGRTRSFP